MDLNILMTNAIPFDGTLDLSSSALENKSAFLNYVNSHPLEKNSEDPVEVSSLIRPYAYNPEAYINKPDDDVFTMSERLEILKTIINDNNIPVRDLFNWVMDAIVRVQNYLIVNYTDNTDTIDTSDSLTEAWLKLTTESSSDDSDDSSDDSTSTTSKYIPLVTFKGQYIAYYKNDKVKLSDENGLDGSSEPETDTPLTDDDMLSVINSITNIKYHVFKAMKLEYSDNSNLLIKTKPYFYPKYGSQGSFNFNKDFNEVRNKLIGVDKKLLNAEEEFYLYNYLHICGVFVYKFFTSYPDKDIIEVDEKSLPYVNSTFYKTRYDTDLKDVDHSVDIEKQLEKDYLNS